MYMYQSWLILPTQAPRNPSGFLRFPRLTFSPLGLALAGRTRRSSRALTHLSSSAYEHIQTPGELERGGVWEWQKFVVEVWLLRWRWRGRVSEALEEG